MKRTFISIVIVLISAYLVYAGWVFITHNPDNPYGEKEMGVSEMERIRGFEKGNEKLASGQELLDEIASGSPGVDSPIKRSDAISLADQLFRRFCRENDVDYEAYTIDGIGSSGNFMWLVQFSARERPSFWVAFDKVGRVEVLDSVGRTDLEAAGF